jgi:VanZ family protein
MVALYVATAATATLRFNMAPPVLEARNIVIHTTGYAVQAILIVRALTWRGRGWPIGHSAVLALTALALGVGQEVLQSVLRGQVFLANSLFDLGIDLIGAALGSWLYRRWSFSRHDT